MSIDLIVAKFGGWSVQDAKNTDRSIDIIAQDERRRAVIVSGPKGLTNLYEKAARDIILMNDNEETFKEIMERWGEICSGLGLNENYGSIEGDFNKKLNSYDCPSNLNDIKAKGFIDDIMRLGEYFEAKYIFAPGLNKRKIKAVFLDPEGIIYGSNNHGDASILPESAGNLRREIIEKGLIDESVVVIPGFYAYTKDGNIVTLPRGGSDTTGGFVAGALDALVYENYTNNLIRRASPDAVENALPLTELTYNEALELAYTGFGIFKDEAIVPCMEKSIPIHVINTLDPQQKTVILGDRKPDEFDITGIAYKSGFGSINMRKVLRSRQEDSALAPYVDNVESGVCEPWEFPIEQIMTSVSNVSFLIPGEKFTDETVHEIKRHLKEKFKLHENDITVSYNISVIAIVGQYMKDSVGINYRVAGALSSAGISTSHIIQGGSELSILYGIHEATPDPINAKKGVNEIYKEFFVNPVFKGFLKEQRKNI